MTEPKSNGLPKWLPRLTTVLVIAGIGVAIYLTIAHYTTPTVLACPHIGVLNCEKVTSSSYAAIFGIPLALLGLLYFIGLLPLQLPLVWRIKSPFIVWGRLAMAATGVIMVFWLVYVELFKLNAICIYCTVVHVIALILFSLTAIGTAMLEED